LAPRSVPADARGSSSLWVIVNSYAGMPVQILVNIVSKRLLGTLAPVLTGAAVYVNSINSYIDLAMFPLVSGMTRNIPVMIAKGETQNAAEVANTALVLSTALMTIGIAVNLAFACFAGDWYSRLMFLAIAATVPFRLGRRYINVYLGAHKKFVRQSQVALWGSLISSLLFLALVFALGGNGFVLGSALMVAIPAWMFIGLVDLRAFQWRATLSSARFLLASSVPMFLFTVSETAAGTIDKLLIRGTLGIEQLGYYGFAYSMLQNVLLFPTLLFGTLFPFLAEDIVRTRDADLLKALMLQHRRISYLMVLTLLSMLLITQVLILLYLPQFLPSLDLAPIMFAAGFVYTGQYLLYTVLVVRRGDRDLGKVSIATIALAVATYTAIDRLWPFAAAFAVGMSLVLVFRGTATVVLGVRSLGGTWQQVLGFAASQWITLIPLAGYSALEMQLATWLPQLVSLAVSFAFWSIVVVCAVRSDRPSYDYYIAHGSRLLEGLPRVRGR
jgi:O-antigen/teichoic acid export membrane protein